MQSQVLTAFHHPYELTAHPLPSPPLDHDILVKVHAAASYCHTDAVYAAGQMGKTLSLVPCHECAGTVVSLRLLCENDKNSSSTTDKRTRRRKVLRVGDRVGVPGRAYWPCGTCFECTHSENEEGYSVYCPLSGNNGITRDGGFQEYALVDSRQVVPIPGALSFVDVAPLMCAVLMVYAALKRCGLAQGETVGIVGCGGGLGHLGLQFAHEMGINVVGVDAADEPLALARDCARRSEGLVTEVLDARDTTAERVVEGLDASARQLPDERGVATVLILPEAQAGFSFGMKLLRPHGICIVVSFPEEGFHVSARNLVFRDIQVGGSLVGSNICACAVEMLDMAAQDNIRARTKTFPLQDLNCLVEEYQKMEGGKLVVEM